MKNIHAFLLAAFALTLGDASARAQSFLTTTIGSDAAVIYRDFQINGYPASGVNNPAKSDIRRLMATTGNAINVLFGAGGGPSYGYSSLSGLTANLTPGAGAIGVVFNDATASNNGLWVKVGVSGTGSWAKAISGLYGLLPAWSIGTVNILPPGETPCVSVTGTTSNPALNFCLVQGVPGPTGLTGGGGPAGPQGPRGLSGSFAWRNAWWPATSYALNDVVSDANALWIAAAPNVNSEPTSVNPNWNTFLPSSDASGAAAAAAASAAAAQAAVPQLVFDTVAAMQAATIANGVTYVATREYVAGNGGGLPYKRGGASAVDPDAILSSGVYWEPQRTAQRLTVSQWGAVRTGTVDDVAAINKALAYCVTVGGHMTFETGRYRVDSTIRAGAIIMNPSTLIAAAVPSSNPASGPNYDYLDNERANAPLLQCAIDFEAGAVILANMAPSVPTAVLEYNAPFDSTTSTSSSYLHGYKVVGPDGFNVSTGQLTPIDSLTSAQTQWHANNLVGLVSYSGLRDIEDTECRHLQYCMLNYSGYWVQIKRTRTYAVAAAAYLMQFNGGDFDGLRAENGDYGVRGTGAAYRVHNLHTEQTTTALDIISADVGDFGTSYLEDDQTATTNGRAAVQIGTGSGVTVDHSKTVVSAGGSGYTAATITCDAPPPGGVQATATATVSGGEVTAITITNPGLYQVVPTCAITGDGTGAAISVGMAGGGLVTATHLSGIRGGSEHPGVYFMSVGNAVENLLISNTRSYSGVVTTDFDSSGRVEATDFPRPLVGSWSGTAVTGSSAMGGRYDVLNGAGIASYLYGDTLAINVAASSTSVAAGATTTFNVTIPKQVLSVFSTPGPNVQIASESGAPTGFLLQAIFANQNTVTVSATNLTGSSKTFSGSYNIFVTPRLQ